MDCEIADQVMKEGKRFKYFLPWELYTMSYNKGKEYFALGSFIEEYCNKIDIINFDTKTKDFSTIITFNHPYPPTKLMWIPDNDNEYPNFLASSGDYLRIWHIDDDKHVKMECLLNTNKESDFCAPITSFDWNELDPNLIGTASIDTTCTIWSLETNQMIYQTSCNGDCSNSRKNLMLTDAYSNMDTLQQLSSPFEIIPNIRTQLIAHDKEVFDIAFSGYAGGKDMFATTSADSSVRIFDLRHLEHSTIIYEHFDSAPLVRLAWNKRDPTYLAVLPSGSHQLILVDIRMPMKPCAIIGSSSDQPFHNTDNDDNCFGHVAPINAFSWCPDNSSRLVTCSDDRKCIVWDIKSNLSSVLEGKHQISRQFTNSRTEIDFVPTTNQFHPSSLNQTSNVLTSTPQIFLNTFIMADYGINMIQWLPQSQALALNHKNCFEYVEYD